jgi:hypothetical protein
MEKKPVTDGHGTDDFIELTKLWFTGPVRLIHFVNDLTPATAQQALKTLGV